MSRTPVFRGSRQLAVAGIFVHPPTGGNQGDDVRSADEKKKEPPVRTGGEMAKRKDRNIGDALRRVYQDAADEKIPDDLLDLLGKLN